MHILYILYKSDNFVKIMSLVIPPELKKITQYIRRAEELTSSSTTTPQTRIVAYYCRQYAVQLGIPLATTTECRLCLSKILEELEKEKDKMNTFTKDESYTICRTFAFMIFNKADDVDRNGLSDKSNAKSFYAAASFLDILSQFHNDDDDEKNEERIEEEKKSFYAKWKATDILKAIREGREVQPGGYGETVEQNDDGINNDDDDVVDDKEQEEEEEEEEYDEMGEVTNNDSDNNQQEDEDEEIEDESPTEMKSKTENEMVAPFDLPPPPSYNDIEPTQPPFLPPVAPSAPPSIAAPSPAKSSFMSSMFGGGNKNKKGNGKYTKDELNDAKELTKFALKALNEKDGDLAIERLQQALDILI